MVKTKFLIAVSTIACLALGTSEQALVLETSGE